MSKNKNTKELTYEKVSAFTQIFDYQCSDSFILEILEGKIDIKKMKSFIVDNWQPEEEYRKFKKSKCNEIYKKGETNYKESLTDILDYLEETESDREDDDEISKQILKDIKNLRKLEKEL